MPVFTMGSDARDMTQALPHTTHELFNTIYQSRTLIFSNQMFTFSKFQEKGSLCCPYSSLPNSFFPSFICIDCMVRAYPYPTPGKNQECPHCHLYFARVEWHLNRGTGCPHDPGHDGHGAEPAQNGIPTWVRVGGDSDNDREDSVAPPQQDGDESMDPPQQDGDESMAPPQQGESEDLDGAVDDTPAGARQPTETLTFCRRSARVRHYTEQLSESGSESDEDDPDDHFGRFSRIDSTGGASQFLPLMQDSSFDEDDDPDITMLPMLAVLDEVEEISRAHSNNPDLTTRTDRMYLPVSDRMYLPVSDRVFDHHFDAPDRYMIRLMDVLGRANCPLWVTDSIVKITREECQRQHGLDFRRDNIVSRETFLKKLAKRFPVPQPILSPITLETAPPPKKKVDCGSLAPRSPRDMVQLVYYDYMDQAKDLNAEATIFGDLNNLCVDPDDPFGGNPGRKDGLVDEVVDAHWYQMTRQFIKDNLVKDDEPFLVVPVAFYADKTGVDVFQRYGVEPLMFTFLLIKRFLRNKADAWRLLGFLPDMDLKSSATKNKDRESSQGKSRSVRNYHRCLAKILESFIENQGYKKPVYGFFRLGPYIQKVRLFFPLACVIGDALSGDHFCGRYQAYLGIERISRACTCHPDDADDLEHECEFLSMDYF